MTSITEAQYSTGAPVIVLLETQTTQSTARAIPYAERYRASSGLYETPVQHLQRAADETDRSTPADA